MNSRLHACARVTIGAVCGITIAAASSRAQSSTAPGAASCVVPTGGVGGADHFGVDPGWLLRERRYPELSQWVRANTAGRSTTAAASVSSLDAAFYAGIVANKENQSSASIRLLEPLLPRLDDVRDSARLHTILDALGDDYTKIYQYGAAADVLGRLQRITAPSMSANELEGLRGAREIRSLLRDAPPQRAALASSFSVPLRGDSIGLLETAIIVGADTAWWIIDTGANFSAITESVARRLGLSVSVGASTTKGITGGFVPLHVAVIPELRLGAARFQNVAVLVFADSALKIPQVPFQITAILGYPVLEALDRITIRPDSLLVRPNPKGVPGAESNLYLEALNPVVAATVEGATHLYHFDSGANRSVLGVRFCVAYPRLMAGLSLQPFPLAGVGGGQGFSAYEVAELPITVGGTTTTLKKVSVIAAESPSPFEPFYGNLGQDLAAQSGGYTLDFRAMTFRLGPTAPPR